MNIRTRKISLFLIFSLLITLSSCVKKGSAVNTAGNGNTIKIGIYGDLTGQTSSFGQSTKNGIELALDEINQTGGVAGKKLEIIAKAGRRLGEAQPHNAQQRHNKEDRKK